MSKSNRIKKQKFTFRVMNTKNNFYKIYICSKYSIYLQKTCVLKRDFVCILVNYVNII